MDLLGKEFNSYINVKGFIQRYQEENNVKVICTDSVKLSSCFLMKKCRWKAVKASRINKALEYYSLLYQCVLGKRTNYSEGVPQKKCPFFIKFDLALDCKNLTISKIMSEHNHKVTKSQQKHAKSHRSKDLDFDANPNKKLKQSKSLVESGVSKPESKNGYGKQSSEKDLCIKNVKCSLKANNSNGEVLFPPSKNLPELATPPPLVWFSKENPWMPISRKLISSYHNKEERKIESAPKTRSVLIMNSSSCLPSSSESSKSINNQSPKDLLTTNEKICIHSSLAGSVRSDNEKKHDVSGLSQHCTAIVASDQNGDKELVTSSNMQSNHSIEPYGNKSISELAHTVFSSKAPLHSQNTDENITSPATNNAEREPMSPSAFNKSSSYSTLVKSVVVSKTTSPRSVLKTEAVRNLIYSEPLAKVTSTNDTKKEPIRQSAPTLVNPILLSGRTSPPSRSIRKKEPSKLSRSNFDDNDVEQKAGEVKSVPTKTAFPPPKIEVSVPPLTILSLKHVHSEKQTCTPEAMAPHHSAVALGKSKPLILRHKTLDCVNNTTTRSVPGGKSILTSYSTISVESKNIISSSSITTSSLSAGAKHPINPQVNQSLPISSLTKRSIPSLVSLATTTDDTAKKKIPNTSDTGDPGIPPLTLISPNSSTLQGNKLFLKSNLPPVQDSLLASHPADLSDLKERENLKASDATETSVPPLVPFSTTSLKEEGKPSQNLSAAKSPANALASSGMLSNMPVSSLSSKDSESLLQTTTKKNTGLSKPAASDRDSFPLPKIIKQPAPPSPSHPISPTKTKDKNNGIKSEPLSNSLTMAQRIQLSMSSTFAALDSFSETKECSSKSYNKNVKNSISLVASSSDNDLEEKKHSKTLESTKQSVPSTSSPTSGAKSSLYPDDRKSRLMHFIDSVFENEGLTSNMGISSSPENVSSKQNSEKHKLPENSLDSTCSPLYNIEEKIRWCGSPQVLGVLGIPDTLPTMVTIRDEKYVICSEGTPVPLFSPHLPGKISSGIGLNSEKDSALTTHSTNTLVTSPPKRGCRTKPVKKSPKRARNSSIKHNKRNIAQIQQSKAMAVCKDICSEISNYEPNAFMCAFTNLELIRDCVKDNKTFVVASFKSRYKSE